MAYKGTEPNTTYDATLDRKQLFELVGQAITLIKEHGKEQIDLDSQPIIKLLNCADELQARGIKQQPLMGQLSRALAEIAQARGITKLPYSVQEHDRVILPIESNAQDISGRDTAEHREYKRVEYVMQVLSELGIDYRTTFYEVHSRKNLGYVAFILPDLQKVIFVNDERSNSTFIVHRLADSQDWETFSDKSRNDLRFLRHFGVVTADAKFSSKPDFKKYMAAEMKRQNQLDVNNMDIDELLNPDNYDNPPTGAMQPEEIVTALAARQVHTSKRHVIEVGNRVNLPKEEKTKLCRVPDSNDIKRYYLPEAVKAILENFSIPETFLNMDAVAVTLYQELDQTTKTQVDLENLKTLIRKQVTKLRKANPDKFQDGHNPATNHIITYCDPSMVNAIREQLAILKPLIGPNQTQILALAEELGSTATTVLKRARQLRVEGETLEMRRPRILSRTSWVMDNTLADKVRQSF